MIGKQGLSGIHIRKGSWAFRGNISKDGFLKFPQRTLDGRSGLKNIPIRRY
jgi:hypothetical protein